MALGRRRSVEKAEKRARKGGSADRRAPPRRKCAVPAEIFRQVLRIRGQRQPNPVERGGAEAPGSAQRRRELAQARGGEAALHLHALEEGRLPDRPRKRHGVILVRQRAAEDEAADPGDPCGCPRTGVGHSGRTGRCKGAPLGQRSQAGDGRFLSRSPQDGAQAAHRRTALRRLARSGEGVVRAYPSAYRGSQTRAPSMGRRKRKQHQEGGHHTGVRRSAIRCPRATDATSARRGFNRAQRVTAAGRVVRRFPRTLSPGHAASTACTSSSAQSCPPAMQMALSAGFACAACSGAVEGKSSSRFIGVSLMVQSAQCELEQQQAMLSIASRDAAAIRTHKARNGSARTVSTALTETARQEARSRLSSEKMPFSAHWACWRFERVERGTW